ALRHPPLSCRTSPPQGGRLAVLAPPSISFRVENWRNLRRHPISPLEGEMSGRTEGGAVPLRLDNFGRHASRFHPRSV
ncbi:MAG: hypothetical protein EOS85_35895, partial [Mesorhizobium sp.]